MKFSNPRKTADRLIGEIRARGEKVKVDLGCGFRKNGNIGIDVTKEGTEADLVCNLGFEPLPLGDNTVDQFVCRDFLEHLPKAYYSEAAKRLKYPIIDLMNEIWRTLRPGGTFTSHTPAIRTSRFTAIRRISVSGLSRSMDYFCGKYPVAKVYGVKEWFELVENRMDRFYLHAVLRKPKPDGAKTDAASAP